MKFSRKIYSFLLARPFVFIGTCIFLVISIYDVFNFKYSLIVGSASLLVGLLFLFGKKKSVFLILSVVLVVFSAANFSYFYIYRNINYKISSVDTSSKHTVHAEIVDKFSGDKNSRTELLIKQIDGEKFYDINLISYEKFDENVGEKIVLDDCEMSVISNTAGFRLEKCGAVRAENAETASESGQAKNFLKKINPRLAFYNLRVKLCGIVDRFLPGESGKLARGVLVGDTFEMDETIKDNFRISGVAHLFAVSGLHLTMWTMLLFILLDSVTTIDERIKGVISTVFIVFFAALTGFGTSVIRAGIMLLAVNLSHFFLRRGDGVNSLFIAVTAMLLIDPSVALEISFRLSVLSTLSFVVFAKNVNSYAERKTWKIKNKRLSKCINTVFSVFVMSFCVIVMTYPVCVMTFGYFSLYSFLSNLLCVMPAEILMVFSALGVLFSPIPAVASFLFKPVEIIASYLMAVTDKISHFPYAMAKIDGILGTVMCFLCVVLIVIGGIFLANRPKKSVMCIVMCFLVLVSSSVVQNYIKRDNVTVTVSNVGNGLAVVLSGNETSVLVGGTTSKEYGSGAELFNLCYRRNIDYALFTPCSTGQRSLKSELSGEHTTFPTELKTGDSDEIFDKRANLSIKYNVTKTAVAVKIKMNDFTCIILNGKIDKELEKEYNRCDVLVVGGFFQPNTDFVKCGEKIYSTSRKKINGITTRNNGDITVTTGY